MRLRVGIIPSWCIVQVFFKMDKGGEGEEVRLTDLPAAKELAFQGFGHELFQEVRRAVLDCAASRSGRLDCSRGLGAQQGYARLWIASGVLCCSAAALLQMCVLAGCDFVASLPGIGIKKAHQHLRRTRCFLKARLHALRCFWLVVCCAVMCERPALPACQQRLLGGIPHQASIHTCLPHVRMCCPPCRWFARCASTA